MFKKTKLLFSRMLQRGERLYYTLVLTIMTFLSFTSPAYAGTPKLVTGTVALFTAAGGWLLLIIPVGAGAVLGYHALQKSLSDDHAVIAEKNKFIKNVIIGAILAETAVGLITVILSFYS